MPAPIDLTNVAAGTGGFVIYGRDADDWSGHSLASAGDVNGDGFDDLIIGADRADGAGNSSNVAGESYLVFGKAGGFGASIDLAAVATGIGGFVIYGQDERDYSGYSVAGAGDVNGDGFFDLIIGAKGGSAAGNAKNAAGESYVVFGKAANFGASIDLGAVAAGSGGFVIYGQDVADNSGRSVASAGDINGDGFCDLIIGAPRAGAAGNAKQYAGETYVVFGKALSFGASVDLGAVAAGSGGFVIYGQDALDNSGRKVASAGDINGDGYGDLIIGAPFASAAGNTKANAGDSYVVFGKATSFGASLDLSAVAAGNGGFAIYGRDVLDLSGDAIASAGDINGDGFDDLVIGVRAGDGAGNTASYSGETYVLFGKAGSFGASVDLGAVAGGVGGFVIYGQGVNDYSGVSVASAGDVNGDGFDDLLIGAGGGDAAGNAKAGAGESYVVFGKVGGFGASIDLSAVAAGSGGFVIYGQDAGDYSGSAVASAGDVNGDGFDDLLVSAVFGDAAGNAKSDAGDSYVIFGANFDGSPMQQGGSSPEIAIGSAIADVLVLGLGNDILVGNGGADVMRGGGGDDLLRIADLTFADLDGGSGTDTLALTGAGMVLDLTQIANNKLTEVEALDLTGSGNNTLKLTALEVLNLSSTSNALRVDGDAGDQLVLIDAGWVRGATALGYTSFTLGQATLAAAVAVTVNPNVAPIDLTHVAAGTGGFVIYGRDADDWSGFSLASAGDVNGDGFDDLIIGAPKAAAAGNLKAVAGESYLVFGKASGFGASVDLNAVAGGTGGFVVYGQNALDYSGIALASAGDINGDGFGDIVIGSQAYATGAAGDSYVLFGHAGAFAASIDLGAVAGGSGGFVIHGRDPNDYSGNSVASAGDINGDGFDDLIIGAYLGDAAGNAKINAGETYLVFGHSGGFGSSIELNAVAAGIGGFVIFGQDAGDRSGSSVASAGDINGDGYADLVIGAPRGAGASNAAPNAGDSYVLFGKAGAFGASIDLRAVAGGTGGFVIHGQDGGDQSGFSVARGGDINGDGFSDIVIGAPFAGAAGNAKSNAGDSYVVYGQAGGFGASIDLGAVAGGTGGFVIHGQDANDNAGWSVASAGDINGDGIDDLVIGAVRATTDSGRTNAGQAFVVFGRKLGFGAGIDLVTVAAGTGGFVLNGIGPGDAAGGPVARGGDINGDGFDDLLVGARYGDADGNTKANAGESYVIFGRDFSATVTQQGTGAGEVLTGSAGADVMIAGQGNDSINGLGGLDVMHGGAGDDVLRVADLGFANLDGGSGTDTLALSGAGMVLDLTQIANNKLTEIEAIDLSGSGNNTLRLTALEVLNLSSTSNTLRVDGDAGDWLVLGDAAWVRGATALGYTSFALGQATLQVATTVAVAVAPTDLGSIAAGIGGFVIHGLGAGDHSGFAGGLAGDINGDGFDDLLLASFHDGESYVVFGKASGFDTAPDMGQIALGNGGFVIHGASSGASAAGDINGDGFADLFIGGYGAGYGHDLPDAYVVFGHAGGFGAAVDLAQIALGRGGFHIQNPYGGLVGQHGDVNGDGFDDLLLAAFHEGQGDGYVVYGKGSSFGASISLAEVAAGIGGFRVQHEVGLRRDYAFFAPAGDLNNDGVADMAFGTRFTSVTANLDGNTYVVYGRTGTSGASVSLGQVAQGSGGFVLHGQDGGDQFGTYVSLAGDLNADGIADLVVAARYADGAGNAVPDAGDTYVIYGNALGFAANMNVADLIDGSDGFVIHGQYPSELSGASIDSAGDINGDGINDLIIGKDGVSNTNYVLFGKVGGFAAEVFLADVAAGIGGFAIAGKGADRAGFWVASGGDLNGDGFDDLLVGAPYADPGDPVRQDAGDSYVIFGRDFTATVTQQGTTNADSLFGSTGADIIIGGLGNDSLSGGADADALRGGAGDDLLIGNAGPDRIDGGSGRDSVDYGSSPAAVSVNLARNLNSGGDAQGDLLSDIENVLGSGAGDVIAGDGQANLLLGLGGQDSLLGAAGNDTLDGGLLQDTMVGGAGDDSYFVDSVGDVVIELPGQGIDTVLTALGYSLPPDIENITLSGQSAVDATGNGADNLMVGNDVANQLLGAFGNDTLDGGLGSDTLEGGAGDDSYVVDTQDDVVTELAGQGSDSIQTTIPYNLAALPHIENLSLTGTAAINATGNASNNLVSGNDAANTLLGVFGDDTLIGGDGDDSLDGGEGNDMLRGGLGNDTLYGGAGNDTFDGGKGVDVTRFDGASTEYTWVIRRDPTGQGYWEVTRHGATPEIDLVYRAEFLQFVDATFPIEALGVTLVGADSVSDTLPGSDDDDSITGLSGNDTILGFEGEDTLAGGTGQDMLAGGDGRDTLDGGDGNDSLDGGNDADTLIGGLGQDTLDGGAGQDTLDGGSGDDALDGGNNADTLSGGPGNDTLAGGIGGDNMAGGSGSDLYFVDDDADRVVELDDTLAGLRLGPVSLNLGKAIDKVVASISYTLTAFVEDLSLKLGAGNLAAGGNVLNNQLTGNEGNNTLSGAGGNDTIDGGTGADSMAGGPGSDTYYVDDPDDQVLETDTAPASGEALPIALNLGSAIDKVVSRISFTLGALVENLDLAAGRGNLSGSGNQLANVLSGNEGNNVLTGGAGNDVFLFAAQGNGIDRITDFSLGDAIRVTGANFTLPASLGNGASLGANQVQLGIGDLGRTLYIGTDNLPGADIVIQLDGSIGLDNLGPGGNQIAFGPSGKGVELAAYSWKAHTLLSDVAIASAGHGGSTAAGGTLGFAGVSETTLALSASRVVPPAESVATSGAVNLQDAIAILKQIVGLDVNGAGKPLSPYQALAADFDGNGAVGLTDAIAVQRHVVGLPSPEPAWLFSNEIDTTVPGKANLNPGQPPAISADLSGSSPVHVGLVGYLLGDVDGSYGGADGALDLDAAQAGYFQALVAAHPGLSLAQFGVYP